MVTDQLTRTSTSVSHPPLLTTAELATHLQLSVWQIYRLAKAKRIPSHHLGTAIRFNLTEVLAATVTQPAPVRVPRTAAQQLALVRLQTLARRRRPQVRGYKGK